MLDTQPVEYGEPECTSLQSRDADAIAIVHIFKQRKKLATYSEALEKLLQLTKEAGLHLHDTPPIQRAYPVVGTIGGNAVVDPPRRRRNSR